MNQFTSIDVKPLTGRLGAEIYGLDIAKGCTSNQKAEVRLALAEFGVITIPNQSVCTPEQHYAFSEVFGEFMDLPHAVNVGEEKFLHMIKREAYEKTKVIGENWHSDATYLERPPSVIAMQAIDVPSVGGDTLFASNYVAYDLLSDGMKKLIEPLELVHSASRIFGSMAKASNAVYSHRKTVTIEEGDREVIHPVVCVHPITGRKHLYVNLSFTHRFVGLTEQESLPLLQYLFQRATLPELTCRIRWQKGSWVVWDNRATMHKAVFDYEGHYRCLYRTTHIGPRPVGSVTN